MIDIATTAPAPALTSFDPADGCDHVASNIERSHPQQAAYLRTIAASLRPARRFTTEERCALRDAVDLALTTASRNECDRDMRALRSGAELSHKPSRFRALAKQLMEMDR